MKRHIILWLLPAIALAALSGILLQERFGMAALCSRADDLPLASTIGQTEHAERFEKATFAAGCFWSVEESFRLVEGVTATRVGYTGGDTDNPTYKQVCTDRTGHAEAVEVTYDPEKVSYEKLLETFWSTHDPTQKNRQGPDVGSQYRSAIFYHDEEQKKAAEASKAELEKSEKFRRPLATAIVPAEQFWQAEEYHQQYNEKRKSGCKN